MPAHRKRTPKLETLSVIGVEYHLVLGADPKTGSKNREYEVLLVPLKIS